MKERNSALKAAAKRAKVRNEQNGAHGTKNRTLSLEIQPFEKLKKICSDKSWTVSRIVDDLIHAFLTEIDGH